MDVSTEVADDEPLLRRIHPAFVKPDGSVSSQAFKDTELSVVRQRLLANVDEALLDRSEWGLVSLIAGEVRRLGLEVKSDPLEGHPAHALVLGKKSKSMARRLARLVKWVRQIE